MNWSKQAIRDASRESDYGRVIQLARRERGFTQRQLGEACGLTQSAVSRLEGRAAGPYNMSILASAAACLGLPPRLVGLADGTAAADGRDPVERREFLAGAVAAAATPALVAIPIPERQEAGQAATLRLATTAFRRMDGSTPSRQLSEVVFAHLRLVQSVAAEAPDEDQRVRLAAVGSEAASLAGWLSWDMGDHGSARTWYGSAIKAARRSGNRLLAAYQIGSLAQMEADAGNAAQGLNLTRSARRHLGTTAPAIADAWLCTVEALSHAAAGDERSTDQALVRSRTAAALITAEEPPPWPWVFTFNEAKISACRVACGARLGLPSWVFGRHDDRATAMPSAHAKQHALLQLDFAAGHQAAGRLEAAYVLATQAVESGLRYRSGRVVERARVFRRAYTSSTPPKVVRTFDDRLHGVYL
ncbi:helix-turn-helix transcriptional regulator [Streptomyces sp. NBC_01410]|uniref:helix-turn-helix domain-containing protein n=1 Tax=Streptomyces sp. NBC_01410 TaxID=2903856 RepID=UPI00324E8EFE